MIPGKEAFFIEKSKGSIVFVAVLAVDKSYILTDYFSKTIGLSILMSMSSILELPREIRCVS